MLFVDNCLQIGRKWSYMIVFTSLFWCRPSYGPANNVVCMQNIQNRKPFEFKRRQQPPFAVNSNTFLPSKMICISILVCSIVCKFLPDLRMGYIFSSFLLHQQSLRGPNSLDAISDKTDINDLLPPSLIYDNSKELEVNLYL